MTTPTFVNWDAYIGPIWKPYTIANAWDWTRTQDYEFAEVAASLNATLADGATEAICTYDLDLAPKGGVWIGPNGAGQGWEYVGYTSHEPQFNGDDILYGLSREPGGIREHNGVHSAGAPVRLWAPVTTNDGKLHLIEELDANLCVKTWHAELSGIAAPRAFLRAHHAMLIRVRYAGTGSITPFLLGWIDEFEVDDDGARQATWKLKIVSIAGMLEKVALAPVRSGDLDIALNGRIIKSDQEVVMPYKERESGDYVAAEPDLSAKSIIDGDEETLFIAERMLGTSAPIHVNGDLTDFFDWAIVTQANINIPPGLGKGYRWIEIASISDGSIGNVVLSSKVEANCTYVEIAGHCGPESHIIVCENLTKFSAANPLATPTRIKEIGPNFFDGLDLAGDCIGLGVGSDWAGRPIKWGNDPNVHARNNEGENSCMSGPCIPSPQPGQVIRFQYKEDATYAYEQFQVDYGEHAAYDINQDVDPWVLVQLPGMGLMLKSDLAADYTGILEIWDGSANTTNGIPYSGTIQIGGEQLTYTAKTSSGITITARGANSTPAAAHKGDDPVYFVDWDGQASDAYKIKNITWKRQGGTVYPKDFKVYVSKIAAVPRMPVNDDEDPSHEYGNDYWNCATVTGHAAAEWNFTFETPQRVTWILIEISAMTADPGRARINTLGAILDPSEFDGNFWLGNTATFSDCITRLTALAGVPPAALTCVLPLVSTDPFKLNTAQGMAWDILKDLADYTSVQIEIGRMSTIMVRDNPIWRTDQTQLPTILWTRANAAAVQFIAERPGPVSQILMKWKLPDGSDGGTIAYPATSDPIGAIQKMNDSIYPDAEIALAAVQRRYMVSRYPFTLGVQAALGNDAVQPGEFHAITWDFAGDTATRTGFIHSSDHVIDKQTWTTAIRLIQLREAYF